jgi:hypothetical protein
VDREPVGRVASVDFWHDGTWLRVPSCQEEETNNPDYFTFTLTVIAAPALPSAAIGV